MKTMRLKSAGLAAALACLAAYPLASLAVPNEWTGGASGEWDRAENWSQGVPKVGDEVVIALSGATVLLTNSTPALTSFDISGNASLVFTNWNTTLNASAVTVGAGGLLTCAGPFGNEAMSNNVKVVAATLTVHEQGAIDVAGRGYRGGFRDVLGTGGVLGAGHGFGGGESTTSMGAGGGHGGRGGDAGTIAGGLNCNGGISYGAAGMPTAPGSGGGTCRQTTHHAYGGDGGGAIRIEVSGLCRIDGTVSANGTTPTANYLWHGGGGSGGSVYIACGTLRGEGGVVSAAGGAITHTYGPGGGAGGRIAVAVANEAQQATLPVPEIAFSVMRGTSTYFADGELGTLHFSNTNLIDWSYIPHSGRFASSIPNPWSVDSLTISNGYIQILSNDFALAVNNDLNIIGANGILELAPDNDFGVGRDLTLRDGATLRLYGHADAVSTYGVGRTLTLTNGVGVTAPAQLFISASTVVDPAPTCAVSVVVGGDIVLGDNAWIYPASHPVNGGSVFFHAANLAVHGANAGFNADERGWQGATGGNSKGDGRGLVMTLPDRRGGGGYGGLGGHGTPGGSGSTYGDPALPVRPGSGGALRSNPTYAKSPTGRGFGGGLIWLDVEGRVTLNGKFSANAGHGHRGGGGSGGGIYVGCRVFYGAATGLLSANGGNYIDSTFRDNAAGGGGGRIAVWREKHRYEGGYSRGGGTSTYSINNSGAEGSLFLGQVPPRGTTIVVR